MEAIFVDKYINRTLQLKELNNTDINFTGNMKTLFWQIGRLI